MAQAAANQLQQLQKKHQNGGGLAMKSLLSSSSPSTPTSTPIVTASSLGPSERGQRTKAELTMPAALQQQRFGAKAAAAGPAGQLNKGPNTFIPVSVFYKFISQKFILDYVQYTSLFDPSSILI